MLKVNQMVKIKVLPKGQASILENDQFGVASIRLIEIMRHYQVLMVYLRFSFFHLKLVNIKT